jgi:hypothetical protein
VSEGPGHLLRCRHHHPGRGAREKGTSSFVFPQVCEPFLALGSLQTSWLTPGDSLTVSDARRHPSPHIVKYRSICSLVAPVQLSSCTRRGGQSTCLYFPSLSRPPEIKGHPKTLPPLSAVALGEITFSLFPTVCFGQVLRAQGLILLAGTCFW